MISLRSTTSLSPQLSWERALEYYRSRGGVVFVSYCRFWEKHAFVQQSLARALVENGVPVTWLDGSGWRRYRPTRYFESENLRLQQLFELPGNRFEWVSRWNGALKIAEIRRAARRHGEDPVIWVQAGIDEAVAAHLPYVDIFSTFDDPYRHHPEGFLCQSARVILCQNSYTAALYSPAGEKVHLALPPVDMDASRFSEPLSIALPENFPKTRFGFIGSFFSGDFDLHTFERLIRHHTGYGFLLMGRTDAAGERMLERWKEFSNFVRLPWVPRTQVGEAWKLLHATLLLYRPHRTQEGAFPTKVLESTYFGVPCVASRVNKTLDLEGVFPRTAYPDLIVPMAEKVMEMGEARVREIYTALAAKTDPRRYLARAAGLLSGAEI